LAAISGYLDVDQAQEALTFEARDWYTTSCLLRRLAELGHHEFALTFASASASDVESGAKLTAALADLLPEELFGRAIEFVRSVVDRAP
jgi:hypothetical protein